MIYRTPYPLNAFSQEYLSNFKKQIARRLAVNDEPDWADFEQIQTDFFGGKRLKKDHDKNGHESKKERGDAYDVYLDDIAWSIKSLTQPWLDAPDSSLITESGKTKGRRRRLRFCLARCAPGEHTSTTITPGKTPAAEAGLITTSIWNKRVEMVQNKFGDFRVLVVLKGKNCLNFILHEYAPQQVDATAFNWDWHGRNLWGINEADEELRWQEHGSQYSVIMPMPHNVTRLSIKAPPLIPDEWIFEKMADLGYSDLD